ncbi:MAG: MFS transporter [SAR324 cluster bacterium]|nr:MFS transporter [SAR324 cluster bacterium]MCH8887342.1 MFS transporter [SAR324 cluster bacterium]
MMCLAEIAGMLGVFTFPALLPAFMVEWGLSSSEAGWISGIYFLGYMVAALVLVTLTDWIDPRRIYLVCMALTVVAIGGFGILAQGFWSALALRALAGVGLAGTYMPGLKALSDLIEGPAQSRAISFYTSSFGIGSALSFYLAGIIGPALDWRMAFYIAAGGPLAALAIVTLVLPANPPLPRDGPRNISREFLTAIRNRRAMGYTLAYMVHNFELFGFRSWLVAFLTFNAAFQPEGTSWLSATELTAIVTLLALPASVTGNELSVRFGRRRVVCAVMTASALLGMGFGFTGQWPFIWVALLSLVYGATVMGDSSSITAGTVQEANPEVRGVTMAVHAAVGFIGSFLGPLIFGVALDLGGGGEEPAAWGFAFATLGVVVALGPLFVLALSGGPAREA